MLNICLFVFQVFFYVLCFQSLGLLQLLYAMFPVTCVMSIVVDKLPGVNRMSEVDIAASVGGARSQLSRFP